MFIRKGTFETNSSSDHAMHVDADSNLTATFGNKDILRNGVFNVCTSDYNWEWYRYYTLEHKIQYLLTGMFAYRDDLSDVGMEGLRQENDYFDMICRVVEDQTGVKIQVDGSADSSIDHESAAEWQKVFKDEDTLKRFLFNEKSYVQTGNDNSSSPLIINSDKGPISAYSDSYREPKKSHVPLVVWISGYDISSKNSTFTLEDGAAIPQEGVDILKKSATVTRAVTYEEKTKYGYGSNGNPIDKMVKALADEDFFFAPNISVYNEYVSMSDMLNKTNRRKFEFYLSPENKERLEQMSGLARTPPKVEP